MPLQSRQVSERLILSNLNWVPLHECLKYFVGNTPDNSIALVRVKTGPCGLAEAVKRLLSPIG